MREASGEMDAFGVRDWSGWRTIRRYTIRSHAERAVMRLRRTD